MSTSREIRVGDKVRLRGWEGRCAGLVLYDLNLGCVGKEGVVGDIDTDGTAWLLEIEVWWPIAALDLTDQPSPWTKTSEQKPDVGVWVLGFLQHASGHIHFCDQRVVKMLGSGQWVDETGEITEPDYWMPLPAAPTERKDH